jgi:2'-5' RNA ligase
MTKRHPEKELYFTCLLPPDSLRRRFNALAASAPEEAEVKRPDDLHITLNYLQIPRKRPRSDLIERLEKIDAPAFPVRLVGVDTFFRIPRKAVNTHVVWLRPDGESGLAIRDLHARILLSLRSVGYNVGNTNVTPHMTALNYPFHAAAEPLRDFVRDHNRLRLPVWDCDRFHLCRTMHNTDPRHPDNNGGRGSKYEIIRTFMLK